MNMIYTVAQLHIYTYTHKEIAIHISALMYDATFASCDRLAPVLRRATGAGEPRGSRGLLEHGCAMQRGRRGCWMVMPGERWLDG